MLGDPTVLAPRAHLGWGFALCVLVSACAPHYKSGPSDTVFQWAADPQPHRMLRSNFTTTDWWDEALHSIVLPITKLASPANYVGLAMGGPRALDVNAFEQVPDSLWFENRVNRGKVSTSDIARGPANERGPADGVITIISGKLQGVSPGFVVRDSKGVVFFVKFDPPSFPDLATGAEMVATRLLFAAGYHVPENYLVALDLRRLVLDPKAKTRNHYNRSVPLTQKALDVLLAQLNPDTDRLLRSLFSRSVPGTPIGPFRYRGVRSGDPNDIIEHQRRRSLRGLWLFSAWLGNVDTRDQNTMDTFLPKPLAGTGLGVIKHYLIDFGASLGSASVEEKHAAQGYERRIDWREIALRYLTLGFRDPLWFRVARSPFREIGIFESEVFDPSTWSPTYNNPAFNAADSDDTLWAASILAHITRADIRAAVSAAEFREPEAAKWVARMLEQRRGKLLRHAFAARSPLDLPRVLNRRLVLTDLVVLAELAEPGATYNFTVRWDRTRAADRGLGVFNESRPQLSLDPLIADVRSKFAGFDSDPYLVVTVRRIVGEPGNEQRDDGVDVMLRVDRDIVYPVALHRH